MTSRWRDRVVGVGVAAVVFGAYELGRARAQNIPSMPTMFYGVSLDENGAPLTGTRDLRVRFFDGEMGGTQLCETLANSATVTQGRARIALSETCRAAVQQNVNVWVELAVNGNPIGARSRIGAVPYAVEAQRANDLTLAAQQRLTAEPECPRGYARAEGTTNIVLCRKVLVGGAFDEVVRVGTGSSAFWVDRFEASIWQNADGSGQQYGVGADNYPPTFSDNGQVRPTNYVFALSRTGVQPSLYVTWFQAQTACRASGKLLPTNEQWQFAAANTPDPGDSGGPGGACLTRASGPRDTGLGFQCASVWGAQDMIGNVYELTSEWLGGIGTPTSRAAMDVTPWPASFNGDATYNFGGVVADHTGMERQGLPAYVMRGGDFRMAARAGVFNIAADGSPGGFSIFGLRCVINRP